MILYNIYAKNLLLIYYYIYHSHYILIHYSLDPMLKIIHDFLLMLLLNYQTNPYILNYSLFLNILKRIIKGDVIKIIDRIS